MLEVARRYDVDGCTSTTSVTRTVTLFLRRLQGAFPARHESHRGSVAQGCAGRRDAPSQWLDWRRSNITAVVRAVAEQARALKPRLKISAAVFRDWPRDRDNVGQDWKLWCDRGWLDFVCPMDYTSSHRQFENRSGVRSSGPAACPVTPALARALPAPALAGRRHRADSHHPPLPDRRIHHLQLRRHGGEGTTPMLGLGITAKR